MNMKHLSANYNNYLYVADLQSTRGKHKGKKLHL